MALYKGSLRVCPIVPKWRGFWSVTVKGFPGTIIDCGTQKTIGESGSVIFKFAEAGTYTFVAEYSGEVETKSITLVDDTYFMDVNMYILSGYTMVEYLKSTGTQHIDTGIYAESGKSWEIEFSLGSLANNCWIGARSSGFRFWCMLYGSNFNVGLGGDHQFSSPVAVVGQKYKNKLVTTTIGWRSYINDLLVMDGTDVASRTTINGTIWLFKSHATSGSSYSGNSQIYYVKIYDNDVLVRDFLPVKRKSDNKPGMLDLVSGQFFTNNGTGEFIAGPEVE